MLTNGKGNAVYLAAVLVFFTAGTILSTPKNQTKGTDAVQGQSNSSDILILPPRVIKYPLFSGSIDQFSVHIKSSTPLDKVKVRIYFPGDENIDAGFFTNNIHWKKAGKYYYLTSIYGKPSEIPIVESFFRLEVKYSFKPDKYTPARLELLLQDEVIKSIPVDFLSPFEVSYLWNKLVSQVKHNPRQKLAGIMIGIVFLWLLYDLTYRRKKRKNIPVCSTRARFSTLIEENQLVKIEETNNPFGCRLGGLKKKIKIEYKKSEIHISISGKKSSFNDNGPVDVDVNEYWKLHIEAQNYYGNDNQSHKNLVILLLPV